MIKSHKGFVTMMNFTQTLNVQFKGCTGLRHHIYFLCYPTMAQQHTSWRRNGWSRQKDRCILRDTQRHRQLAIPSVWCSIMRVGIICFIYSPSGRSLCECSEFVHRFSYVTPTISKMPIINILLVKNQAHQAKPHNH